MYHTRILQYLLPRSAAISTALLQSGLVTNNVTSALYRISLDGCDFGAILWPWGAIMAAMSLVQKYNGI